MRQRRPPNQSKMSSWALPAILLAIILGAVAVFIGYQVGLKSVHGTTSTPTPGVITPTPAPAPTPSLTAAASATPTAQPTPGTTTTPGSTPTPAQARSIQAAAIRTKGYSPRAWSYSLLNGGGTIWAWRATCAGSAEHYCQTVFFFNGTTLIGTDTKNPSRDILSVRPLAGGAFAVKYADYQPGDADCCPSGKPVKVVYTWNGASLTASGTPPGS